MNQIGRGASRHSEGRGTDAQALETIHSSLRSSKDALWVDAAILYVIFLNVRHSNLSNNTLYVSVPLCVCVCMRTHAHMCASPKDLPVSTFPVLGS